MATTSTSNSLAHAPQESSQSFAFPASFAQRRLWFLDQLVPGDVSYNVSGAVEIEGEINTEALKKSLQEIVRRHESLRTLFRGEQGESQQVIYADMPLSIEVVDLQSLPEQERATKAEQLAREKANAPFDLKRGPLFRVSLLQLGEQHYWLVVMMHHIISDGWSVGVLVRELVDLYSAFAQDMPSPLPELPIQYVDYTAWQQEQLSGERLQAEVDYWKNQLEGSTTLEIVTDHPRGARTANKGATERVQIEPELARDVKLFAQEHGATLYMVLLAAFQTLLHRYSGQTEVLVGSPIAGRTQKEAQLLIGFFVNTLVMKANFDPGITFRQLLRQVKETTLGAYAHQELPFEKLVEELSPDRNSGRTPFFQAVFAFQNAPMPELELGSAKLRMLELPNDTAKFEMTIVMQEFGNLIRGSLEYSTDLYEAATISALLRRYVFLLESLVHDPDRPVSQAPLVDEEERSRLAQGWRSKVTRTPLAAQKTWAELIAEHARDEKKVALIIGENQITYRDLNQRAGEIAGQLQAGGVQPGARVAVCTGQTGEMALALLGVFKAGAVAVPVDTDGPTARMESILKDAEAGWALTEGKFEPQLRQAGLKCIVIASGSPSASATAPIESRICKPEEPALLVYQSGGSGRPEGVVVPHRGLLPRTFALEAKILPADLVGLWPQLATEENGILEVLHCLGTGATIVQLDADGTPRKWASTIREQKVDVLFARGPEIERLAREFGTTLKNVRFIVCTDRGADVARLGENLKGEMLDKVYLTYGLNETCGWCALYPLSQRKKGIAEYLAAGVKLELLDADMNPQPEGIVGEIFIGGEHLALGYNNLGGRTKEVFLSDEYSSERGACVFRSGDMGWHANDGTLRMFERRDGRAWIAGVRVEPAEVEAALKSFDGLQDAAVLIGQNGVSAFLVAGEKAPETDKLEAWLLQKVPKIMLPRTVHLVERIPRLGEAEVDRLKLKVLAKQLEKARDAAAPYAPPESDIERKLVAILEKTLGLERVGIHDDFFRIGGHSLLATQVVAQISHELGVELPLRRLFEAPTVAQLAQAITELSHAEAQVEAIPQIKRIARVPVQQQTIAK